MWSSPKGFIYVWGGTGHDLQGFEEQELYEFDTYQRSWKLTSSTGWARNSLNSRYFGRTSSFYENKVYFFGGGLDNGEFLNTLFSYDLTEKEWDSIQTTGDLPCPRYKHQSCIVGDKLFVIGGGCYLPTAEKVDVYVLCLKTFNWTCKQTFGQLPKGRVSHTCEYDFVSNSIYLWGGFDRSLNALGDFYKLDLNTFRWFLLDEHSLCSRAFHSACSFQGSLYSFCGSNGHTRFADLMRFQIYTTPQKLSALACKVYTSRFCEKRQAKKLPAELNKKIISFTSQNSWMNNEPSSDSFIPFF